MPHRTGPAAAWLAAGLAACLAPLPTGASAQGFTCGPPPTALDAADRALAQAVRSPQLDGNARSALKSAVATLRGDGVSGGAIVDRAVAAYCPLVAKDGSLSDARKREAVSRFAADLTAIVYPAEETDDVILSLPLSPALSERVEAAAANANETRGSWVRKAIEARLATP